MVSAAVCCRCCAEVANNPAKKIPVADICFGCDRSLLLDNNINHDIEVGEVEVEVEIGRVTCEKKTASRLLPAAAAAVAADRQYVCCVCGL